MNPADLYFDVLRSRAQRADDGGSFGREELISEAAHEAYRRTADRLTADAGWDEERALVVTRGLNEVVKGWLQREDRDWDGLHEELRRRAAAWERPGSGDAGSHP
jgi:hypothetical protein